MPTATYTPLANITLGSSAASVTFSSISQAYRDLVLVWSGKGATAGFNHRVQFNGDTTSNYFSVRMSGNGSAASSASNTLSFLRVTDVAPPGTTQPDLIFTILDYSATDKHKSVLSRANSVDFGTEAVAGRWGSTSALTQIYMVASGDSFAAGSSFSLYGIAA